MAERTAALHQAGSQEHPTMHAEVRDWLTQAPPEVHRTADWEGIVRAASAVV